MFRSFFNRRRETITIRGNEKETKKENLSLKVNKTLQINIENLRNMLDNPDNLKIRELKLGDAEVKCAVVYIDGLVDEQSIQHNVLGSLQVTKDDKYPTEARSILDFIYWKLIGDTNIQKGESFDDLSFNLLSGFTILFIDGIATILMIDTAGGEFRSIEEPVTETLIRGPREGFIESVQRNVAMIRRRIKDPNLRFKTYQTGRRAKKSIVVTYVDGIIDPKLLKEVDRRLKTIDIDIVPETGYIEEWIEDSFLSPFPQFSNTERPDKVIAAIMQGKVAIMLDGTPFALIAPVNFSNVLQSPEDYYERWTIGSLLRVLRYLGAFISVFLPSLYIALISLQPGMIPSSLVFSIAATREGVPFPPIAEALMMVITMELLQEAGARLPQTIGQTIGIVGGLVIGEAAVQAGIVSPIMVIVVALTAIANFSIPSYSVAISFRIVRFGFMFAAAVFGMFGIILVYIMINIHFVNLKSFGVPYSAPFAPFFSNDWHDVVIRSPIQTIKKRPDYLSSEDKISLDNQGEK
ncbi:spore germination protein [Pseudogracilibacillus sp. SO30301A]